jgi:hypothetical protein
MTGTAGEELPLGRIKHRTSCMHSKGAQAAAISLLGGVTIFAARRALSQRRARATAEQARLGADHAKRAQADQERKLDSP